MAAPPHADADVRPYLAELGIPGIVDVHVHFMPDRVQQAVWDYFDRAEVEYGRSWPIEYRSPAPSRLAVLRELGVVAFPSLVYAHRPGMAAGLNAWALNFAARTPGCVPTMTFYPEPDVADYVASALFGGARIVKLHVQVGDFDPRDPLLDPAWQQVEAAGVPVVIHCGSGPLPGRHTGVGPVSQVLQRFPSLRLVIAHLGAPEYEDFIDLAERNPLVCLDTTMAATDFMNTNHPIPATLVPRLRDLALDARVVFGSDFPSIPYAYAHQIESLARLGFDDGVMRTILWDSGSRLLNVSPGSSGCAGAG